MSVDQKQLHIRNVAKERRFPNLLLLIMILLLIM
jgi:hypothetical protein